MRMAFTDVMLIIAKGMHTACGVGGETHVYIHSAILECIVSWIGICKKLQSDVGGGFVQ